MNESLTKYKVYIAICAILVSFAVGRFSVGKPEIKTDVAIVQKDKSDEAKDTHITTTTKEITDATGKKEVDTTTTTDIVSHIQKTDTSTEQVLTDIIPAKVGTLNISMLGGVDTKGVGNPFVYGASVTKQILGPISLGVFGLTNGTAGVSVGISF